jgi:regulatory protein YycH of two-component signal transduction system YycFG
MATSAITLNGTAFATCRDVSAEYAKIGSAYEAADGTRRFAQRAMKNRFVLRFDNLTISQLNSLRTIQALTTSFAYVNGHGTSYTVICREDPLTSAVDNIDQATDVTYTAELTVWEV